MPKIKTQNGLANTSLEEIEAQKGVNATSPAAAKGIGAETPEQAAAAGTKNHTTSIKQKLAEADQTLAGADRLAEGRTTATTTEEEANALAEKTKLFGSNIPRVDQMIQNHLKATKDALAANPEDVAAQQAQQNAEALITGKVLDVNGDPVQEPVLNEDGSPALDEAGQPIMQDVKLTFGHMAQMMGDNGEYDKIKASYEAMGYTNFEAMTPEGIQKLVDDEKAKVEKEVTDLENKMALTTDPREYAALAKELKDKSQVGSDAAAKEAEESLEKAVDFVEQVGESPDMFAQAVAGDDVTLQADIKTAITEGNPATVDGLTSHGADSIKFANEVASDPNTEFFTDKVGEDGFNFDPTWTASDGTKKAFTKEDHIKVKENMKVDEEGMQALLVDEDLGLAANILESDIPITEEEIQGIEDGMADYKELKEVDEKIDKISESIPLTTDGVVDVEAMTPEQQTTAMNSTFKMLGIPAPNMPEVNTTYRSLVEFEGYGTLSPEATAALKSMRSMDSNGDGVIDIRDAPALLERFKDSSLSGQGILDLVKQGANFNVDTLPKLDETQLVPTVLPVAPAAQTWLTSFGNKMDSITADEIITEFSDDMTSDNMEGLLKIIESPAFKAAHPNFSVTKEDIQTAALASQTKTSTEFFQKSLVGVGTGLLSTAGFTDTQASKFLQNPNSVLVTAKTSAPVVAGILDHLNSQLVTATTPAEKAALKTLIKKWTDYKTQSEATQAAADKAREDAKNTPEVLAYNTVKNTPRWIKQPDKLQGGVWMPQPDRLNPAWDVAAKKYKDLTGKDWK